MARAEVNLNLWNVSVNLNRYKTNTKTEKVKQGPEGCSPPSPEASSSANSHAEAALLHLAHKNNEYLKEISSYLQHMVEMKRVREFRRCRPQILTGIVS